MKKVLLLLDGFRVTHRVAKFFILEGIIALPCFMLLHVEGFCVAHRVATAFTQRRTAYAWKKLICLGL